MFYIVLAFFFAIGHIRLFLLAYLVAALHELGHVSAAFLFGYKVKKIGIEPFGVNSEIVFSENTVKNLIVIYAGPFVNVIFLVSTVFINKEIYRYFIDINVYMLVINLLPVYPLDGGRAVFEYLLYYVDSDKLKTIRKISSFLVSVLIIFLGCIYFLHTGLNFSLLIIGLFLISQLEDDDKTGVVNNYVFSRKCIVCCASGDISVYDVARKIDFTKAYVIYVIDNQGRVVGVLTGKTLYNSLLEGNYHIKLFDLFISEG